MLTVVKTRSRSYTVTKPSLTLSLSGSDISHYITIRKLLDCIFNMQGTEITIMEISVNTPSFQEVAHSMHNVLSRDVLDRQ